MLKTQKLNQKTVTDGAVKAVSVVTGMMAGGSIQNVMPENLRNSSDAILAVAGGAGAVLVKDNSTTGTVVKYASLGVAARSLYAVISSQFQKAVPALEEGQEVTIVDKLVRGAVGLSSPGYGHAFLASPGTINFNDYPEVEAAPSSGGTGSSLLA